MYLENISFLSFSSIDRSEQRVINKIDDDTEVESPPFSMICVEVRTVFSELREALNTKWNVNILEPRDGIGGHCQPKDSIMFLQSSKSIRTKIIQAAMEVDEDYRRYRQTRSIVVNSTNPLMKEQKRTAISKQFSCGGIQALNESKNKMTNDQILETTCNLIDE
jgi:UDP-N-acetyl-D-mannosaminuronate dehydrogenase